MWLSAGLALAIAWGVDDAELIVASLLGMGVGARGAGLRAERSGRRSAVFSAAFAIAGAAFVAAAVGTGRTAPGRELALAAHALLGATAGGALAAGALLVAELAPRRSRGAFVAALGWGWSTGALVGIELAAFAGAAAWGRIVLVFGAVPLLAWPLLRALPESPRWLASHGRATEADAVVRRAERASGGALITVTRVAPVQAPAARRAPLRTQRLAALAIVWLGVGVAIARVPEILIGSPIHTAIDELAAVLIAVFLVDRIGRRPTLALALLLAAIPAAGLVRLSGFAIASLVLALGYTIELVPGSRRALLTGALAGGGFVAAAVATVIGPATALAAFPLAAAAATLVAGPEPRGRSLESPGGSPEEASA